MNNEFIQLHERTLTFILYGEALLHAWLTWHLEQVGPNLCSKGYEIYKVIYE